MFLVIIRICTKNLFTVIILLYLNLTLSILTRFLGKDVFLLPMSELEML